MSNRLPSLRKPRTPAQRMARVRVALLRLGEEYDRRGDLATAAELGVMADVLGRRLARQSVGRETDAHSRRR